MTKTLKPKQKPNLARYVGYRAGVRGGPSGFGLTPAKAYQDHLRRSEALRTVMRLRREDAQRYGELLDLYETQKREVERLRRGGQLLAALKLSDYGETVEVRIATVGRMYMGYVDSLARDGLASPEAVKTLRKYFSAFALAAGVIKESA